MLCGTAWTGSCNCGKKWGEGEGALERGRRGILRFYEDISTSFKPLPPKEPLKSVLCVYEGMKIDTILYLYVKYLHIHINVYTGFPGGSVIKNPPAVQETQVQSLGWEDPLEKEMATHSSILAWEIPWTEGTGYCPWGHKRVRHDLAAK